ncbi:MAG: hypothetical protein Salg2KO_08660 [Salibacteraceae bacterium]
MNNVKIAVTILCAIPAFVLAQGDKNTSKNDLSTTVIAVNSYRPTISDAKKIAELPQSFDTNLVKQEPTYLYGNDPYQTEFKPDSISAAKIKSEAFDPLYRAYVKAGAGNGINYLSDIYIHSLRSRNAAIGFEAHGRGAQGVFNELPAAPYNRMDAKLTGKKFLKKHAVEGYAGYDRERLQYYGYDLSENASLAMYNELTDQNADDDVAIRNQFRQVYQRIKAGANLKSFYTDSSSLNHTVSLDYENWSDRNRANSENNILLNANVSRYFGPHQFNAGLLGDFNFVNYVAPFSYSAFGTVSSEVPNMIFGLKPTMVSEWKKFRVEYGANVQLELASGSSTPRIYPHVYAKYNLVKEIIIPYAGLGGGLKRNSLSSLSEQNPFLWIPRTALSNTDEVLRVYGGFRGSISNKITYNIQASQFTERNSPLFVNYNASEYNTGVTTFGENYFSVVYDTIDIFELSGELMYRVDERLQVAASGVYRRFTTQNEFEAWHRPDFEIALTGFYQIQNKIIIKAESHILGPQWAKSYDASLPDFFGNDGRQVYGERIAPVIDINLGLEYRYTERLSGFVNLNNVIAQRYQRWNQYPNQRINVVGGITYSFWKD